MTPAVQIKCPKCQNSLRVPPGLAEVTVKCKFCGNFLQLKKKRSPDKAALGTAAPTLKTVSSNGAWDIKAMARDELVEYTPPIPSSGPAVISTRAAITPIVEPMSSPEPKPVIGPNDYTPAFERAGKRHMGRGSYKGPRGSVGAGKWIAISAIVLIGAVVVGAVVLKPEWFKGKTDDKSGDGNDQAIVDNTRPDVSVLPGTKTNPVAPTGPFPRRMLAIGISNYLYVNPILYGTDVQAQRESDRHDFYRAMQRIAVNWKFPKDQVYFVADGPVADNKIDFKHPPLKMVIEGTIDRFLTTCRPQDRILIVFAGHAIEKDGEAYLVPLEGEFDEPATLIPLKQFYAKLDKCPAQEKLIIYDVCRFNPTLGAERPTFGEMTPALEKALHDSPNGVSIWTSCSAGQNSYEAESDDIPIPGARKASINGSYFQSMFIHAEQMGRYGKGATGDGMHKPSDPFPVGNLSTAIDQWTKIAAKDLLKKDQTPKLTIKTPKSTIAYDKDQALAQKIDLAESPPTANREAVASMFKELDLPKIKAIRMDEADQKLADNFPFTKESLEGYMNKGPTFEDIQKNPEQHMKDYPLRVATVSALVEMRKLKQGTVQLPEDFKKADINDALKKKITDTFQRTITERQSILDELKDSLEEVGKKREMEKSKRWLANYDYATAQVKARLAYIYEYNLALGKVKLEELPELVKNQDGWRLASTTKMVSPKEIRDMGDEAKALMAEIVKQNPDTPWAVLAKTHRNMALGLSWQASSSGSAKDEKK